ncbi:MAG: calcium/sodium antiporter [Thermoanaerobaculia bacterium]|nr:calcium/sodium antiporter [Thermoanaerobaculia bacterium]
MTAEASMVGGVLLLWLGGEYFVRGSVGLARRLGVSELMIGLTLVGFGTSLPELTTSVTAALSGAPGLTVGNVVGSNIANVLLILGLAALIRPVTSRRGAFATDAAALAVATLVAGAFILSRRITAIEGLILIAGLATFVVVVYRRERRHPGPEAIVLEGEAAAAEPVPKSGFLTAVSIVAGLAGVTAGAWLLVGGAVEVALRWGVSKTFIGLTIVAVGTSLPELVITAVASLRGRSDVALGNIMGSNMFNLLGILGVAAVLSPLEVGPELRLLDLAVMVVATALLIVTSATRLRVTRWEGGLLLGGYVIYAAVRSWLAVQAV